MDQTLGSKRRYSPKELTAKLASAGFQLDHLYQLNRAGSPAWYVYGRILKSRHISKVFLKVFDKTIWLWRFMDRLLPWSGVTAVCVASRVD